MIPTRPACGGDGSAEPSHGVSPYHREKRIMCAKRYGSMEEWKREEQARRRRLASEELSSTGPPVAEAGRLRVEAEVAPHADPSAAGECRRVVVEWLQDVMEGSLPRKAWRHGSFSHGGADSACRAVRIRDARRDYWGVQLERSPAAGQTTVTEIVVGHREGRSPAVAVEVVDLSVVPADPVAQYPAGVLAAMAEQVPLLQEGRKLTHLPIVVDSAETMRSFHRMLVDPQRSMPFAVVSVPPDTDALGPMREHWEALARTLTGLAIVWVLPAAMTYRLSDLVSKSLSVFLGAWRFYRPGFTHHANRTDHPLVLRSRLDEERGIAETTRQFLRMAAAERMKSGSDDSPSVDYQALAREAASTVRGPGRLVALLRGSLRGGPAPGSRPRLGYALSSAGGGASAGGLLTDGAAAAVSEPATVREPAARSARRRGSIADELQPLQRRLREATAKARARASRYERAKRRAAAAERERDEARRRAEQLAGLVRSLGGNPDAETPFPTAWDEFAPWCDENLADRLVLTGSARRDLAGAGFGDVSLAARCLDWLASTYRDRRLGGGDPQLHGRIDDIEEGVFNVPCGGDSFECSWGGCNHRVDWHIKRGANTRDPRRCLRIYYFWDESTGKVVVASMPAHRRSSLT